MFKPFSWIFEIENYKEHFKYLFLIMFKFLVPAICLSAFVLFYKGLTPLVTTILVVLAAFLFVAPFLCVQGYFWELTSQIISREWDLMGASVYNGKMKEVYKITLPDIKTKKFIWRGFASVVANIIMCWPLFAVIAISSSLGIAGAMVLGSSMLEMQSYSAGILGATLIYAFLAPALLWNYAKQDSVFAVLNFRKAVFVAGNYSGKYLLNCILYAIFNALLSYLFTFLVAIFQIQMFDFTNPIYLIKFALVGVIGYFVYVYCIFVNAYLLGTIAPPCEA